MNSTRLVLSLIGLAVVIGYAKYAEQSDTVARLDFPDPSPPLLEPVMRCEIGPFRQRSSMSGSPVEPVRVFTVFFHKGSWNLGEAGTQAVAEIAAVATARGTTEVYVWGYTNTVGSENANREMSLCRAAAVARELAHGGIKADSISIWGFGARHHELTPDRTVKPVNLNYATVLLLD